jgi:hypothetical protein
MMKDILGCILTKKDDYKKCNRRLSVVVTKMRGCSLEAVKVSEFRSNEDVVEAVRASVQIPFVCGGVFSYKGFIDGGAVFDDNLDVPDHYVRIRFYKTKNFSFFGKFRAASPEKKIENNEEIVKQTQEELERVAIIRRERMKASFVQIVL